MIRNTYKNLADKQRVNQKLIERLELEARIGRAKQDRYAEDYYVDNTFALDQGPKVSATVGNQTGTDSDARRGVAVGTYKPALTTHMLPTGPYSSTTPMTTSSATAQTTTSSGVDTPMTTTSSTTAQTTMTGEDIAGLEKEIASLRAQYGRARGSFERATYNMSLSDQDVVALKQELDAKGKECQQLENELMAEMDSSSQLREHYTRSQDMGAERQARTEQLIEEVNALTKNLELLARAYEDLQAKNEVDQQLITELTQQGNIKTAVILSKGVMKSSLALLQFMKAHKPMLNTVPVVKNKSNSDNRLVVTDSVFKRVGDELILKKGNSEKPLSGMSDAAKNNYNFLWSMIAYARELPIGTFTKDDPELENLYEEISDAKSFHSLIPGFKYKSDIIDGVGDPRPRSDSMGSSTHSVKPEVKREKVEVKREGEGLGGRRGPKLRGGGMIQETRYKQIGTASINLKALHGGKLSLRMGANTKQMLGRVQDMGRDLTAIVKTLVYDGKVDREAYRELAMPDKRSFDDLLKKSSLVYSEKNWDDPKDVLMEEYHKLAGEIEINNDNPEIKKKLRKVLTTMLACGLVKEKRFNEIIDMLI